MPVKTFKASLYDVRAGDSEEPLADDSLQVAIRTAASMDLRGRAKSINDKVRRLETWDFDNDQLLLNFVTAEFSGPGRTADGSPTEPIELESDENFAHETAMLYDPNSQIVLLESGLGGIGPGAVRDYLATFIEGALFRFDPRLDDEASARARRFNEIRRIEYRLSVGPPSEIDEQMGMGAINAFASLHGAAEVTVVVKAERRKSSSLSPGQILSNLRNLVSNSGDHHVNGCKVYGRENEDDRLEEINLFLPTVKFDKNLLVDETARKVMHEIRWHALREFHGVLPK